MALIVDKNQNIFMKKIVIVMAALALMAGCAQKEETTVRQAAATGAATEYHIPYSATTVNPKEGKRVLVVEGSPRHGGNSDLMADEFVRGATEAGGLVEKIFLADYNLQFLSEEGADNPKEAMRDTESWQLVQKFLDADVVALSTPVYFMNVSDRMKAFIDCTYLGYGDERMRDKEYYFLTVCADNVDSTCESAIYAMRGFIYCLPGSTERGSVKAYGIGRKGAIKESQFLQEAYELGKTINKQ